jgi:hypothetical protein
LSNCFFTPNTMCSPHWVSCLHHTSTTCNIHIFWNKVLRNTRMRLRLSGRLQYVFCQMRKPKSESS